MAVISVIGFAFLVTAVMAPDVDEKVIVERDFQLLNPEVEIYVKRENPSGEAGLHFRVTPQNSGKFPGIRATRTTHSKLAATMSWCKSHLQCNRDVFYFRKMSIEFLEDVEGMPNLKVALKFSDVKDKEELEVEAYLSKEEADCYSKGKYPYTHSPFPVNELINNMNEPFKVDVMWMEVVLKHTIGICTVWTNTSDKPTYVYAGTTFRIDENTYDQLVDFIKASS